MLLSTDIGIGGMTFKLISTLLLQKFPTEDPKMINSFHATTFFGLHPIKFDSSFNRATSPSLQNLLPTILISMLSSYYVGIKIASFVFAEDMDAFNLSTIANEMFWIFGDICFLFIFGIAIRKQKRYMAGIKYIKCDIVLDEVQKDVRRRKKIIIGMFIVYFMFVTIWIILRGLLLTDASDITKYTFAGIQGTWKYYLAWIPVRIFYSVEYTQSFVVFLWMTALTDEVIIRIRMLTFELDNLTNSEVEIRKFSSNSSKVLNKINKYLDSVLSAIILITTLDLFISTLGYVHVLMESLIYHDIVFGVIKLILLWLWTHEGSRLAREVSL